MKKLLVVLALVAMCMSISAAQAPMTISLGPTAGVSVPMGDLSNVNGIGFYGGARAKFKGLVAPVNFNAAVTYNTWGGKDLGSGVKTEATNSIQIAVGAEYPIPMEGFAPYVGADIMYSSTKVSVALPTYTIGGTTFGGGTASATNGAVGFAFGVGAEVSGIDISAKYQAIDSGISALAVGAAYYFSL